LHIRKELSPSLFSVLSGNTGDTMIASRGVCIITATILILTIALAGCITPVPQEPTPVSLEESREIARDYVTAMEEYRNYDGRNLTLIETITLRCPYCWQFVYSFEMQSMKDPSGTDLATVRVTVIEGTVREVVAGYGRA
jgi:hypothetical protein